MVIMSHNLDEVQKVCHRFAIMDEGQLKMVGNIEELNSAMGNTDELQCRLRAPVPDDIARHLKGIDGVKEVFLDGNLLKIYGDHLEQATPQVVVRLVDGGCNILEVKRRNAFAGRSLLALDRRRGT